MKIQIFDRFEIVKFNSYLRFLAQKYKLVDLKFFIKEQFELKYVF